MSTFARWPREIFFDTVCYELQERGIELRDREALEQYLPVRHAMAGELTGEFAVLFAACDILGNREVVYFQT